MKAIAFLPKLDYNTTGSINRHWGFGKLSLEQKPLVLLVDDAEEICSLVQAILRHDYEVDTCNDGGAAIERLTTRRYSVLLLDLRMPGVDGFTVLEHLRDHQPEMLGRVLVVTANLRPRDLSRARGFGVHGVIAKPFDVDQFREAVRGCAAEGSSTSLHSMLIPPALLIMLADLFQH